MMNLYNRAVYWPDVVERAINEVTAEAQLHRCYYGDHAKAEAQQDRFGRIVLPLHLPVVSEDIFEAELTGGGRLHKFLTRIPLDQSRDIVMVLVPRGPGHLFCKTVWINHTYDHHQTLKREHYIQEPA